MNQQKNVPLSGSHESSVKNYLTGFILSIILTAIPFAIVMMGSYSEAARLWIITVCAIVQIIVHLVYFLHLSPKSDGGWNFSAFIFMVLVVGIIVIGSLWIMFHLDMNMMPK